jgi:hypothetical protein
LRFSVTPLRFGCGNKGVKTLKIGRVPSTKGA